MTESLWAQYQKHVKWWEDAVEKGQKTQEEWDNYKGLLFTRYYASGMKVPDE